MGKSEHALFVLPLPLPRISPPPTLVRGSNIEINISQSHQPRFLFHYHGEPATTMDVLSRYRVLVIPLIYTLEDTMTHIIKTRCTL